MLDSALTIFPRTLYLRQLNVMPLGTERRNTLDRRLFLELRSWHKILELAAPVRIGTLARIGTPRSRPQQVMTPF